jgi:hypothetical protein
LPGRITIRPKSVAKEASRVDRVERELRRRWQFDHFGSGPSQFLAKRIVLRLGLGEIGGMMKSERSPARRALRLVPSGNSWRADSHTLQRTDHGMAVELDLYAGLAHSNHRGLL